MPMRDNAAVEQTTSRPAKRRKTEVACQECRDKKTKCDGQRPTCGPCKRKRRPSATCVYPGTRRQSSVEMAELHLLRSEVQDLRQILRQTPQVPAVRPNGGVPGGSSSAATANRIQSSIIAMPVTPSPVLPPPALSGSWNATPVAYATVREIANKMRKDQGLHGRIRDHARRAGADCIPRPFQRSSVHEGGAGRLVIGIGVVVCRAEEGYGATPRVLGQPSPPSTEDGRQSFGEVLDLCPALASVSAQTDVYGDVRNNPQALIHRMSRDFDNKPKKLADRKVDDRYDHIFGKSGSHNGITHNQYGFNTIHEARAFHITLNLIFALGCTYHCASGGPVPFKNNAVVFFDRSQELLRDADLNHGSLSLAQAFLLTAHYLQSTDKVNKCWLAAGTAIRLAQGIGIQLDLASESQAERQERRRPWCGCILMDRPPMVTWPTSAPLPEPIDDGLLLREPGSSSQPPKKCADSEVASFVQALKLSDSLMEVLKYLHQRILLFRPITIDLAQGAFLQPEGLRHLTNFQHSVLTGCIMSCVRAAQELVNLLFGGNANQVPPWWYSIFLADFYTAGTAPLAVVTSPTLKQVPTANVNELNETWARCMQSLARYDGCESGFSRRWLQVLQKVYAERSGEEHTHVCQNAGHDNSHNDGLAHNQQHEVAAASAYNRSTFLNDDGFVDDWLPVGGYDWLISLPDEGPSYGLGTLDGNFV
ncbi:fungal-specific transcription factor domain-containing protein [Apiospora saccharicola]|uniref:Fungal-specific transcription factor domain-containing protein n=1 Tax=Apiospora saccharicola TaxID=335842 RepID=A0ABR1W525_9PEZI